MLLSPVLREDGPGSYRVGEQEGGTGAAHPLELQVPLGTALLQGGFVKGGGGGSSARRSLASLEIKHVCLSKRIERGTASVASKTQWPASRSGCNGSSAWGPGENARSHFTAPLGQQLPDKGGRGSLMHRWHFGRRGLLLQATGVQVHRGGEAG